MKRDLCARGRCVGCVWQCRQNLLRAASELNDRAHQYRLVEKRLLVRFKDRNPAPLNNLDVLLQSTHEQLITLGNKARGPLCVFRPG